jgi:hypothetical protein
MLCSALGHAKSISDAAEKLLKVETVERVDDAQEIVRGMAIASLLAAIALLQQFPRESQPASEVELAHEPAAAIPEIQPTPSEQSPSPSTPIVLRLRPTPKQIKRQALSESDSSESDSSDSSSSDDSSSESSESEPETPRKKRGCLRKLADGETAMPARKKRRSTGIGRDSVLRTIGYDEHDSDGDARYACLRKGVSAYHYKTVANCLSRTGRNLSKTDPALSAIMLGDFERLQHGCRKPRTAK